MRVPKRLDLCPLTGNFERMMTGDKHDVMVDEWLCCSVWRALSSPDDFFWP